MAENSSNRPRVRKLRNVIFCVVLKHDLLRFCRAGLLQTAHSLVLTASMRDESQSRESLVENAKWLWARVSIKLNIFFKFYTPFLKYFERARVYFFFVQGDRDAAQTCLEKGIRDAFPNWEKFKDGHSGESQDKIMSCAKVRNFTHYDESTILLLQISQVSRSASGLACLRLTTPSLLIRASMRAGWS